MVFKCSRSTRQKALYRTLELPAQGRHGPIMIMIMMPTAMVL